MHRNGKIARLPRPIRTDLNHRLDDGQEADSILPWLNELPLVQQMVEEQFGGVPISPQNLSEWRQGGFREWLLRQELIEHAGQASDYADDLDDEVITSQLPGKLAALLAARYAALLGRWNGAMTPEMADDICVLRGLNKDIALLQKTLQAAEKQKREQEKAINDEEKWLLEEEKKRQTAPIMAQFEAERMALSMGGGEQAQKIAEYLAAVKFDLPPPREYLEKAKKQESPEKPKEAKNVTILPFTPASSDPIKANQTNSGQAEGKFEQATEASAPVKAASEATMK
jgi:hypothetical protein